MEKSVEGIDVGVGAGGEGGGEGRFALGEAAVAGEEVAFGDLAGALAADLDEARVGREAELAPLVKQGVGAAGGVETGRDGRLDDDARGELAQGRFDE